MTTAAIMHTLHISKPLPVSPSGSHAPWGSKMDWFFSDADILVARQRLSMGQGPGQWVLNTQVNEPLHCSRFTRPAPPMEQEWFQTDRNQWRNTATRQEGQEISAGGWMHMKSENCPRATPARLPHAQRAAKSTSGKEEMEGLWDRTHGHTSAVSQPRLWCTCLGSTSPPTRLSSQGHKCNISSPQRQRECDKDERRRRRLMGPGLGQPRCSPLVFVNKALLKPIHAHSFVYRLWLLPQDKGRAKCLQPETSRPEKSQTFTVWDLTGKACPALC